MRLELAERLQCPRDHRPTPLVVVAAEVVDRDLRRGTAGCMECGLMARFQDGDLRFSAHADAGRPVTSTPPSGGGVDPMRGGAAPTPAAIDRLQALLGLAESGGAVLLSGRYAAYAAGLQARLDLLVVVADPDDRTFTSASRVIGRTRVVPFTEGTFRAAALDDAGVLEAAVGVLRAGGRVVAPSACARPAAIAPLAVDATEWVGERHVTPTVIPLQRSATARPAT